MIFHPHAYTITITRRFLDGEFIYNASVAELPDVETFEPTYIEAYDLAADAIKTLAILADEAGESFPMPKGI